MQGQYVLESNINEGVIYIPLIPRTEAWLSHGIYCYIYDTWLGFFYPSAEMESVYSATPVDRTKFVSRKK